MISEPNELLRAALMYAERGWHVLPLQWIMPSSTCSCKRPDCRSVGKHPLTKNGLKDASVDANTIRGWWQKWPEANIGVATGPDSGIVVLDVDNKANMDGDGSLQELMKQHSWAPQTLMSKTGSGRHYWFRYPSVPVKTSASKLARGLDVRADGGYVVAPPSRHALGNQYRWASATELKEPAELPEWLLEPLTRGTEAQTSSVPTQALIEPPAVPNAKSIPQGERNNGLTKTAGLLRWAGLNPHEIEGVLRIHNQMVCDPPLDDAEIHRIAASMASYPPGRANPDIYWFELNVEEWFSQQNRRLMSDYQRGWLINLLAGAWLRGGTLLGDLDRLAKLAQADDLEAFKKDCDLVLEEFELHEVGDSTIFVHPELAKDFLKTIQKCFTNHKNGKKGGEKSKETRVAGQFGNDFQPDSPTSSML